jgi:hypothetical protein
MSAEFTRDKETESPGQLTQLSKQLLGLPEKPAGATTAADMPPGRNEPPPQVQPDYTDIICN